MEPGIIFDKIDEVVNKDPHPSPLPTGEGTHPNDLSPQDGSTSKAYT